MTWMRNDHYIGRSLELYGEYSESEAELLRRILKPGAVVVEAGANVGSLTLPIAEAVGGGMVCASEPQPAYYRFLAANTRVAPSVFCIYGALGEKEGTATFRSIEESKIHAPGWESTGPEFEVMVTTIDGQALYRAPNSSSRRSRDVSLRSSRRRSCGGKSLENPWSRSPSPWACRGTG
jgi:FkbM family methyltransferase